MALLQRDAAQLKAQEFESKYLEALAREAELQEKLRVALEASVANAGKLITLQEKHARELKEVRRKLEKAQRRAPITGGAQI